MSKPAPGENVESPDLEPETRNPECEKEPGMQERQGSTLPPQKSVRLRRDEEPLCSLRAAIARASLPPNLPKIPVDLDSEAPAEESPSA